MTGCMVRDVANGVYESIGVTYAKCSGNSRAGTGVLPYGCRSDRLQGISICRANPLQRPCMAGCMPGRVMRPVAPACPPQRTAEKIAKDFELSGSFVIFAVHPLFSCFPH